MRAKASNTFDWIVRAALVIGCVCLVASNDGALLLWRNAIVLVPLAALVAMMCRWLPCRPVTRHTLWLVLLVWLVIGAIVPPISFESGAESGTVVGSSNGVSQLTDDETTFDIATSPISEGIDEEPASRLTHQAVARPARENAVRSFDTRPVDYSRKEDRPSDTMPVEPVNSGVALESEKPELPVSPPQDRSKTICDADIVACGESEPIDIAKEHCGDVLADTVPTPPLTVARTESREPSYLTSDAESDVQLSLLTSNIAAWFSSRFDELQDRVETWNAPRQPNRYFSGLTRIQARRAAERLMPARIEDAGGITGPAGFDSDESPKFTSVLVQAYDSAAAFLASRVKPWGEAISGIRDAIGRLPALPSAFWFAGIGLVLAARILRGRRFRAIMSRGRAAPSSIRREVRAATKLVGLREAPITLVVKERISPMIWFDGRPTLVLPIKLWRELDDEGRKAVLFHELAHLRRRDHWVCRIESLIGAIYWWHPLVWWIRGRLREEAENCCDAWVTWLQPGGRRAYAEALIRTNQFISQPTAPVPAGAIGMTSGPARRFARRLTMVMTQSVTPTTSRSTLILAIAVLATGWLSTPARSCDPKKDEAIATTLVVAPAAPSNPFAETLPEQPTPPPQIFTVPALPPVPAMAPGAMSPVSGASMFEVAPIMALAIDEGGGSAGAHGGGSGGQQQSLEQRLARLEERLARLTEMMEGGHGGLPRTPHPVGVTTPIPPAPPAEVRNMRTPAALPGVATAGPSGQLRARIAAPEGAVYAKTYKIPDGRREGIWELMALPDVPPRVRQVAGGIELQGTTEQHMAFGAFVDMISGESGESIEGYRLPAKKLEAMTALMSRSDVPVMVEGGDEEIRVHGTSAVQHIFRNFVNLIHPGKSDGEKVGMAVEITGDEGAAASWLGDVNAAHKMALEQERIAAAQHEKAAHARSGRKEAETDALRRAAEELMQQAAQLEEEADRLSDEADTLNDRAAEMTEAADSADDREAASAAKAEARAMEVRARQLEKASQKLHAKAAQFEQQGSELEEKLERMAEEVEAAAEAAEAAEEADAESPVERSR